MVMAIYQVADKNALNNLCQQLLKFLKDIAFESLIIYLNKYFYFNVIKILISNILKFISACIIKNNIYY